MGHARCPHRQSRGGLRLSRRADRRGRHALQPRCLLQPRRQSRRHAGERRDKIRQFIYPVCVSQDPHGNFYVGEYGGNDRVQKFSVDGKFLLQIGRAGQRPGRVRAGQRRRLARRSALYRRLVQQPHSNLHRHGRISLGFRAARRNGRDGVPVRVGLRPPGRPVRDRVFDRPRLAGSI